MVESVQDLEPALAQAAQFPARVREMQEEYVRCSLGEISPGIAGARGADAIVTWLNSQAV